MQWGRRWDRYEIIIIALFVPFYCYNLFFSFFLLYLSVLLFKNVPIIFIGYLIFLMYYLKCAFGYRNLEHVNMFSSNTQGMKPRLLVLLVARFRSIMLCYVMFCYVMFFYFPICFVPFCWKLN